MLFGGEPVSAFELRGDAFPWEIDSNERALIGDAGPQRTWSFVAGRLCAHAALRALGIPGKSLLRGSHGQPQWPEGLVGSISHTENYAIAAVARGGSSQCISVGIDAEPIRILTDEVAEIIMTPAELRRVEGFPSPRRPLVQTIMFCAKEALYKAQFALTGRWLDFESIELRVEEHPGVGQAIGSHGICELMDGSAVLKLPDASDVPLSARGIRIRYVVRRPERSRDGLVVASALIGAEGDRDLTRGSEVAQQDARRRR